MIRTLVYVAIVFLIAAGFAWLADRPGVLLITWQGYEVRSSLMIAALAAALVIAALAFLGAILRMVLRSPHLLGNFLGQRRRERGYRALSAGMIAVGAGDVRAARRAAAEATALLGTEPLTLLLTAQAAQLAGDGPGARKTFEALSERPDTRILGLHGLFIEARRQGEDAAARHFAEDAAELAPRIGWAGTALFEYQSRAGDWQGALQTLFANAATRLVDKAKARRLRAVLLTARAMELEAGGPDEARLLAQEAHRLAPDLVPAAVVAGRLLTRKGEIRRAVKVLETAWKATPHPEIAEAYGRVRPGDSTNDRLKRMRRLTELRANHPEGAMALARAAMDARDWAAARAALGGLVRLRPSERVCLLMAEIEEGEHGDQGRVRTWLTRALNAPRDPAWTADGRVFDAWAPVSPISGRVDAFEWKVVAEHLPAPEAIEIAAASERPPEQAPKELPVADGEAGGVAAIEPASEVVAVKEGSEAEELGPRNVPPPMELSAGSLKPVLVPRGPLVAPAAGEIVSSIPRAPDDPGPEPSEEQTNERFGLF